MLQSGIAVGNFPTTSSSNSISSYNYPSVSYHNQQQQQLQNQQQTGNTLSTAVATSSGFNMKNFIKSRTASIGNSSASPHSKHNKNPSTSSASHYGNAPCDPKNPVIVHLSMQQNSGASSQQHQSNIDQPIYLNPAEIYSPHPSELPDPSRHQVNNSTCT